MVEFIELEERGKKGEGREGEGIRGKTFPVFICV
jgi:hypothetical protein